MDEKEQFIVTLASEKGSSNWLNALPLKKYGFNINQEFRDGLCLRYHWDLENPPNIAHVEKNGQSHTPSTARKEDIHT